MRKYIIYCLMVVLLIGLVPIGSSAAEDSGIHEVVIYLNNKKGMQTLNNEENLVLGDIEVTYDVNYENNEVNVYLEEEVFIVDVISIGNTVHKSIKFDSEDEVIVVNKELETNGYMASNVKEINLKYENVEQVEIIKLISFNSDENDWIGILDEPGIIEKVYVEHDKYATVNLTNLYRFYDNNKNTYKNYTLDRSNYRLFDVTIDFTEEIDVRSFKLLFDSDVTFNVEFYDIDGNRIGIKHIYSSGLIYENVNFDGVKTIRLNSYYDWNVRVYEFEIFRDGIKEPQKEVTNLNYTVNDNTVTLTWTNPESENFQGVNIYRDGKLIKTTTEESFSENLQPGVYQYRISTIEAEMESLGVTIDVSIEFTSAPSVVKNIRIINKTSTGGTVTWTENPVYENIEKYIVSVNGEKHGETVAPPYTLEGLEEGKSYIISVQAVNSYGISEPPSIITYTPTKIAEIGQSIKVGDIFSHITMLFRSMWPLLALVLAIILSPKIYHLIKSNVT